jgi:hypothetical protein
MTAHAQQKPSRYYQPCTFNLPRLPPSPVEQARTLWTSEA